MKKLFPLALLGLLFISACSDHLKRAQESYRIGDYTRALRLFEAELDQTPESFDARYGYAMVLQELSLRKKAHGEDSIKDWLDVVREYEICARVGDADSFSENYAISLFHLANKYYLAGQYILAQEYLDQARREEPKNKFVLNLAGIVEYSQGKYKEAQETFEFLLAIDPAVISAYLNLGNVLWEQDLQDEALATWKQALSLSPGNPAIISRIEAALQNLSDS